MRHYDFEAPLIQTRTAPALQHPRADARDYLLLDDLVGGVIEFELRAPYSGTPADASVSGQ